MKNLVNYVKSSDLLETKIGPFHIIFKDQIKGDVDVKAVFDTIIHVLPNQYLEYIDVIYIGQFDFLNDRNVNAMYMDESLFISNIQDNDADLIDDIIHEIAHALEERHTEFIYGDGKVEDEFILKRSKLQRILKHQGYDISQYNLLNSEYDENLDELFYREIGYDVLGQLTIDLYTNPYAATSLREYVASCFEEFYIGKSAFLKEICPYIYKKLYVLHEQQETYNES